MIADFGHVQTIEAPPANMAVVRNHQLQSSEFEAVMSSNGVGIAECDSV
jgi:hypothetical protein